MRVGSGGGRLGCHALAQRGRGDLFPADKAPTNATVVDWAVLKPHGEPGLFGKRRQQGRFTWSAELLTARQEFPGEICRRGQTLGRRVQ